MQALKRRIYTLAMLQLTMISTRTVIVLRSKMRARIYFTPTRSLARGSYCLLFEIDANYVECYR